MKWQDTTPHWRPQPISDLRARALQRWPDLLGHPLLERLLTASPVFGDPLDAAADAQALAPAEPHPPWLLFERPVISAVVAHLGDVRHEQGGLLLGHAYGAVDYCIPTAADGGNGSMKAGDRSKGIDGSVGGDEDGEDGEDADGGDDAPLPIDEPSIAAICVTEVLPSIAYDASAVSLRMESRLWDQARERLRDSAASGLLVIGWYHSHPDLGAFFSGTDERTQAAFFAHRYSIGWVIDPIRGEHACFLGKASEPVEAERILLQRKGG